MNARVRSRRTGVVLLVGGVLCLGSAAVPIVTASADAEPGSGLGSFSLTANAPVLQVREDYAAQQCGAVPAGTAGCEGVVNETVSSLSNGPIGHALSSVAWPGTLAGNLGTLLVVASGGQVPSEAMVLNSPVRAEARIGGKNPVVTDYPPAPAPAAAHMKAEALPTKVTAEATLGGAQSTPVGSIGTSTSRTATSLTGAAAAMATAHSEVHDVTIGPIHLGSLVSDATATTDGSSATARGRTVVTGATVAGVPVSIDENGVTVQAQNVPFPKEATDAVNAALAGAGMTVVLSRPHGTPDGASVTYDAGSLVLIWKQAPDQSMTAVVGGAQVSVASTPGFSFGGPPTDGGTTGGTTGFATGGTPGTPPLTGPVTPGTLPGTGPPPAAGLPPVTLAPATRAATGPFPEGVSPWLVTLGVLGSGLVMAGLRRLPDHVLAATSSSCPNGDTP